MKKLTLEPTLGKQDTEIKGGQLGLDKNELYLEFSRMKAVSLLMFNLLSSLCLQALKCPSEDIRLPKMAFLFFK